jgi:polysaccharide biosynthesis/export protein
LRLLGMVACLLLLAGCGGRKLDLPMGTAAYDAIPAQPPGTPVAAYTIGPRDQLSLTVYQEPELSMEELYVDNGGYIQMPLVGQVKADGRTAQQLSADIASRLKQKLLVNPQVAVNVTKSNSRTVTVDGQVKKPGMYEIPGTITLVQAVALAEGTSDYAKLDEIVVMRTQGSRRYAARFDLDDIRSGRAPDPQLQKQDIVVVGFSSAARTLGLALAALPTVAGLFIAINQFGN